MLKRIPIFAFALVMLITGISASAGTEDSETVGITYITITANDFVADSLDGAQAYYNLYDSSYDCGNYVTRYYRTVYGVEIKYSGGPKDESGEYSFEVLETEPKRGDIAYASPAARGKSYGHWAIVKSYSDGVVTLIEQNWRYGTQAGVERQIVWPSSVYTFYTMTDGERNTFPSLWAEDGVEKAFDAGIYDAQDINCYRDSALISEFETMLDDITALPDEVEVSNSLQEDGMLTRGEAALIVAQALEEAGVSLTDDPDTSVYIDIEEIETDTVMAMCALIENKVMHAYNGCELRPDGEITIEHAMIIALAALNYYDSMKPEKIVVSNSFTMRKYQFNSRWMPVWAVEHP